eukprot:9434194-Alexandrium_andersonii.AAC.1
MHEQSGTNDRTCATRIAQMRAVVHLRACNGQNAQGKIGRWGRELGPVAARNLVAPQGQCREALSLQGPHLKAHQQALRLPTPAAPS